MQLVYKTIMAVLHALNPILRPRTLGHNSGTRRDIFGSSPGGGDAGRHVLVDILSHICFKLFYRSSYILLTPSQKRNISGENELRAETRENHISKFYKFIKKITRNRCRYQIHSHQILSLNSTLFRT